MKMEANLELFICNAPGMEWRVTFTPQSGSFTMPKMKNALNAPAQLENLFDIAILEPVSFHAGGIRTQES